MRWHPQHSIHDVARFLERQWEAAGDDVSPHDSTPMWSELSPRHLDVRELEHEREEALEASVNEREPEYEDPVSEPQRDHP